MRQIKCPYLHFLISSNKPFAFSTSLTTVLYFTLYKVDSTPDFRFLCVSLLSLLFCVGVRVISLTGFFSDLGLLFYANQRHGLDVHAAWVGTSCRFFRIHVTVYFKKVNLCECGTPTLSCRAFTMRKFCFTCINRNSNSDPSVLFF